MHWFMHNIIHNTITYVCHNHQIFLFLSSSSTSYVVSITAIVILRIEKGQHNCINFGKLNRVIKSHKKVITNDLINSFYEYQVWKSNTNNKVFTKILSNLNSGSTIRNLKLQKQNFIYKYIFMAHLTPQLNHVQLLPLIFIKA